MKQFPLIALAAIFLLSCAKNIETETDQSSYLQTIRATLKDSLSSADYNNIDFARSILTKAENEWNVLRIPFGGKKFSEEFVLLQTDSMGKMFQGLIVKLHRNTTTNETKYVYNGTIKMSYLNREEKVISKIINGYISTSRQHEVAQRSQSMAREEYPDVLVGYYYLQPNGGMPTTYVNSSGFFGFNSGGRTVGYIPLDGNSNTDDDPGSRTKSRNTKEEESLMVDFEFIEDLSPIDVAHYLKCFSNIPDAGSTCSIEILTDIPVDENPNKLFNWTTASPGHTFLHITKTNGNQSVTQNIGFYPVEGWKTLFTTAPVAGKFVDNSEHEFNASLKMSLTPEGLKKTLDEMLYLSSVIKYDIDEFNCTDFALDVFNVSRISNPLVIPKYDIPGGTAPNGTNTPQGLFNELKIMQASGAESENISIPDFKSFVASSKGSCN